MHYTKDYIDKINKLPTELPYDGHDYHVVSDAVESVQGVPGMACEIGLRRGGGSKFMIDAMIRTKQKRTLIGIDPYGNIDYITKKLPNDAETVVTKMDYTNEMRDLCIINMYLYSARNQINFLFFPLEDTEFFKRYADGVPVYEENKRIETQYAVVYFDGPHQVDPVRTEIEFFDARTAKGSAFIFDDVSYYDHSILDRELHERGWVNKIRSPHKWSYIKNT